MPSSGRLSRISWSFLDQGVVSGGTFALNVLLARALPAEDYGSFALLIGGLFTLQLFNGSLLHHPLSVRLAVAPAGAAARLVRASLVLVLLLSAMLGVVLAGALLAAGRADLLLPGLAYFLVWQQQEALRRCLFATFRHRAALPGDMAGYLLPCLAMPALAAGGALTLVGALHVMTAAMALAAAIHALQLGIRIRGPADLGATARDFWSIGGGWSIGNGLLLHGRAQALLWLLAATTGPAAVAAFQVAQNVVNLTNPVLIGLYNVIPSAASRASARGVGAAWRAARGYALLAVPPVLGYAALLLIAPQQVIAFVYGDAEAYADLALVVRLLVLAVLLGHVSDVVLSFLHGIAAIRTAFLINAIGAAATALIAVPLTASLGVAGTCATHLGTNLVRLGAAWQGLARLLGRQPARPVASAA